MFHVFLIIYLFSLLLETCRCLVTTVGELNMIVCMTPLKPAVTDYNYNLTFEQNKVVFEAVQKFLKESGRFS